MNNLIKDYIENNIHLLEQGEYKQFFDQNSPDGLGLYLYQAEIPFMENLEYVPSWSFSSGGGFIKEVVIPKEVKEICKLAFYDCDGLETVIISEGVENIDNAAFACCSDLTNITIPSTVTHFGISIFKELSNKLTIKYNGTIEQWRQLTENQLETSYFIEYTCNCLDGSIERVFMGR